MPPVGETTLGAGGDFDVPVGANGLDWGGGGGVVSKGEGLAGAEGVAGAKG